MAITPDDVPTHGRVNLYAILNSAVGSLNLFDQLGNFGGNFGCSLEERPRVTELGFWGLGFAFGYSCAYSCHSGSGKVFVRCLCFQRQAATERHLSQSGGFFGN